MSGHSKWSTIKHKKGAADAKRGKVFTKLIKEITVAARMGGGDIDSNPRLRTTLIKARTANMPKDNIERAIKKGAGGSEGVEYLELQYEAYAPGGVGLLIEALTENKNRTAADVRSVLGKGNGSLAAAGAVSFQFRRKGVIAFDLEQTDFDKLFEVALEAGAEDVADSGEVYTDPAEFETVLGALEQKNFSWLSAEIEWVADNSLALSHEDTKKVLNLIERLEDCDDVQSVACNLEIPKDFDPDSV
ncbi:YebC/PmpR family DNA-binding transcriptional regulator [Candidatus Haliotispira prima]|uniref:Probable transcriptional regulatory protein P0082_01995 n=1 Tax=Candidatus Haliotispira prima TaxID=3034016 RepID=A0ABY8MI05_9SPIO|nr:YebC/PmpR family DNA-binding transcriptional regulator [Candidatus Haliotispira prima]